MNQASYESSHSFKALRGFIDVILNPAQFGRDPYDEVLARIRDAVSDLPRTVVIHVLSASFLGPEAAQALLEGAKEASSLGVEVTLRPVRPADRALLERFHLQSLMPGAKPTKAQPA